MSKLDAALSLMGALVLEDGRRWGEVAAPFQWEDARAVLDPAGQPYHFVTRGRGGSKTSDLAGVAVAALLSQLPAGARCYACAADRDQGRLLLDSVEGFVARTPELRGALEVDAWRVTATRGGSVLEVLAADHAGAWGLRPHLVVIDELSAWATTAGPRRLFEALTSAVAKIDGARLAIITSAGDPAHWAYRVLEHARADALWRVSETPGPVPWLDPERLAEQERRLPPSSYARLFLNRWTAPEDRLTTRGDLEACVTLEGPLAPVEGTRYVVALDLGIKKDRTVATVQHAEPIVREDEAGERTVGHRVVLDRIETWQGSRERPVQLADVEEWVAHASERFNGAPVILDPWQAVGLAQRLRSRGIRVEEYPFTAQSVGRLAAALFLLLRNRALALPRDPELLDELAHVRLRETSPGTYRLDHDSDRHDDRAIALALGAHRLVEVGSTRSAGGLAGVIEHGLDGDYFSSLERRLFRDPRGSAELDPDELRADVTEEERVEERLRGRREAASALRGARPAPDAAPGVPGWWRKARPGECFYCGAESTGPVCQACMAPKIRAEMWPERWDDVLGVIAAVRGEREADRFALRWGEADACMPAERRAAILSDEAA